MKITEVRNSATIETGKSSSSNNEETSSRKRSLLERFNIPVEHLDFSYVKKCNDARTVERILRVLRSGEEGCFPDLERFVAQRLEQLNPGSRLLRVETPALHSNELGDSEKEALTHGLTEWLSTVSHAESQERKLDIFDDEVESKEAYKNPLNFPLPVRGTSAHSVHELTCNKFTLNKSTSNQRIKSWEYDKWDKFDVDAELTKLDITDMQVEEWERREKPKVVEEQKQIQRLMKESGSKIDDILHISKSKKKDTIHQPEPLKDEARESFAEVDTEEEGTKVNTSKYFKTSMAPTHERKAKIFIDDLHMST